jgi:predicted aldo/keto reductase-like oxidoreductase
MTTVEVSDLVGSLMSPGMSIKRYVAVQRLKGRQNRWTIVECSCCEACMSPHRSIYIPPNFFDETE